MDASATVAAVRMGAGRRGAAGRLRLRLLLVVALAAAMTVTAPSAPPAVAAGPAVRLTVMAPATATAGAAFGITVTARDAAGLVATSYRGRVTFTSTDTRSPVLPAAYTFTAADAGRHTFTGVRLFSAGSRTIAAFDTVAATVKGRSAVIAVGAGPATRLAVTAPATAASGVAFGVSVTARDAWSNVATGYRGTVRFTSSDPGNEALPAPYAFTATDRGLRAFPGVVLVSAGSRTVTATDTVAAALTGRSATIAVAPRYALYRWDVTTSTVPTQFPSTPTLLGPETRWLVVDQSGHTLAIRSDRTLWAWGSDTEGQLGDGAPNLDGEPSTTVPQRVGTRADWATVAVGVAHSLAVKTNGTLWAWGSNAFGQLGDGTATSRSTPVQIGAGQTWASVSTFSRISAGITTGGTLWLWGGEHTPQHSHDDDTRGSLVPLQIGTDTDWASVSVGNDHVLAVKRDGSLWAWGGNWAGQLGIGTRSGFVPGTPFPPGAEPVRIGTARWASVEAAALQSYGIRSDGTLWAWGAGSELQGDGVEPYRTVPVQIGSPATWRSVSHTYASTLAIRSDGTLWIWRQDQPMTQVGSSGGWVAVSAGYDLALGLRSAISAP